MAARVTLKVAEARLDEFEAWFREAFPLPASSQVCSFDRIAGDPDVVYTLELAGLSTTAAETTKSTWQYIAPPSVENDGVTA